MPHKVKAFVLAGAGALAIATASPARAAVITYNSSAAFLAAVTSSDTWTFNGPNYNPVIRLNSLGTDIVSVATQGGDAAGIIFDNALCGRTGSAVDCFKPVVFTILEPRNAFGFDNLDFTVDEEAVVVVNFAGGAPPFSKAFGLGGHPAFTPTFFGIISDDLLASVTVYSRTIGSTAIGQRANVIDNVIVGSTAVPEPTMLLLVGSAMASGLLRRRVRA